MKRLLLLCAEFIWVWTVALSVGVDIPVLDDPHACEGFQPKVITQPFGFIVTPGYDRFHYYPSNLTCSWTLVAPTEMVIKVKLMEFQLGTECAMESLEIFAGVNNHASLVGAYCDYLFLELILTNSSTVHLRFHGSEQPHTVGFKIYFEHSWPLVNCDRGFIRCRHGQGCVSLDKKCDGVDDCLDGTDEEYCGYVPSPQEPCGLPEIKPSLISDRIVGGQIAIPGSWPWQLALRLAEREPLGHMCGGVLINRQWAVTAGHCFRGFLSTSEWTVHAGKFNSLVLDSTEQIRYMRRIFIHPDYYGFNNTKLSIPWLLRKANDLALVQLNAPFTMTADVQPICLTEPNTEVVPGTFCYVTGWGSTQGTGGDLVLKQAVVPVVSKDECERQLRKDDIGYTIVCAGHEEGGQDACKGDSGGPLVLQKNNTWELVAVVSSGALCAEPLNPGVYTKISPYGSWIESVISEFTDR